MVPVGLPRMARPVLRLSLNSGRMGSVCEHACLESWEAGHTCEASGVGLPRLVLPVEALSHAHGVLCR